ncbi:MAG TPA: plasmid pRiA4b ORF-3 family protein, partial [Candidatus Mediterraneibacter norwichensis]|nr:plasmid pRiA4b ORF-3 family protein [Candidatus Mediterraneibacter norwichensis]
MSHWEHPAPGQEFENEADRQAYEEYQRAFGWQNSHLHRFSLPQDRFLRITEGKAARWLDLTG